MHDVQQVASGRSRFAFASARGRVGILLRATGWLILVFAGFTAGFLFLKYRALFRPPSTRLALNRFYREMPPDERHHYLFLPVDHKDTSRGLFKSFYILSPSFAKGGPVVFLLTDGQMELVDTQPDFGFFEGILPGFSYVLIGVRGHAPTLFPEVFRKDGTLNLREAMSLYGSDQQVEDIEEVRADMQRNGYLASDGRILIFGASGAGILAQQYLSKYGEHVSRAILEVTGAPDLSKRNGWHYSRDFADFSPASSAELSTLPEKAVASRTNLTYLLYQLARTKEDGKALQLRILQDLREGKKRVYLEYLLRPQYNLPLARFLLSAPSGAAVKVRWYELTGYDLQHYGEREGEPTNLLCEFSKDILSNFLAAARMGEIAPKDFTIERGAFGGEVLVVSGSEDVVFSPQIGRAVAQAYPKGRWILLQDGHHMQHNQEYLTALHRAFLIGGFESEAFGALDRDPRVVEKH
jgi:pimeloyl-ACP methyl ester carboxylesterase